MNDFNLPQMLTELPSLILIHQTTYNNAAYALDRLRIMNAEREAEITIQAYTTALFDDGKGSNRPAKNEEERKVAAQLMASRDPRLQRLSRKIAKAKQTLDAAQAQLDDSRATQTNCREIARLTVAQLNYARSE